jgi:hypothetical protein
MDKSRRIILSILNLIGFLAMVIVNALAVILPINNKTTGQLSDQYPNLFVPVGLTFSIWGVIYTLLAILVIFQVVATIKNDKEGLSAFEKIGYLFFGSSFLNIGWIFAWQYEIVPLSLVIMLMLLGCLIAIYFRLNIGRKGALKTTRYIIHLPFSIYLGWITIATIANVTAFLVSIKWDRFGLSEQFWTVAVIIVGIAIALSMLITRQDIYFGLVVDWALVGIFIKRLADTIPAQSVITTAIVGITIITIGIITQIARRKVYSASQD